MILKNPFRKMDLNSSHAIFNLYTCRRAVSYCTYVETVTTFLVPYDVLQSKNAKRNGVIAMRSCQNSLGHVIKKLE